MLKMKRDFESRDDGFTVVEIVVAAAILFFVLTAVLGLVATTTNMSLSAKQRTAMVNTVSSHMEWIRTLSFDELDVLGTTAEAVVDPERVLTVDGYIITINTQITEGRSGTKEVRVIASAAAPGRTSLTMESFAAVWDAESGFTDSSDPDAPIIEFGVMTPDSDAVLYGSSVWGSGSTTLFIDAEAHSPLDDGVITELRFSCAGYALRDGSSIFSDVAAWTPSAKNVSQSFQWDTGQVEQIIVDGSPIIVPVIEDGWRTVRISATDAEGRESVLDRRFYVDNVDPDNPGVPIADVNSNVETRISWEPAMDGSDPADRYDVTVKQVVSDDGTLVDLGTEQSYEAVFLHMGSSFSRYSVSIQALSPRNNESDVIDIDLPYVTKPLATGTSVTTYSGRNNTRRSLTGVAITCDTPNFPVAYATYDVFRSMDPNDMGATPYATDVGPEFTENIDKLVRKFGAPDPWYYQFRVNYVASGYAGFSAEEPPAYSNIIGPITAEETTVPMEHVQW